MKNHAMLEADDKERLPMLSMNANKEKQIEHLVKIRKEISEWKVYTPGRLKFALSWTIHAMPTGSSYCRATATILDINLMYY